MTLGASRHDLPAAAQNGGVFDQSDFLQGASAAWNRAAPQGKKLADVG
jgi:hypothetical protein